MPSYDWDKIRREYITDGTASFRSIAQKHNIPRSTLEHRAKKEKWFQQRTQHEGKKTARYVETIEAKSVSAAEAVMQGVEVLARNAMALAASGEVGSRGMHDLAVTFQILGKMLGLQPDLDEKEQKARIASIEARAGTQEEDDGGGAILIPEKDWDDDE